MEKVDSLIGMELTFKTILILFLHKIPLIIAQTTPIALLLAIITFFSFMLKNNELVALQSCGISIKILLKPTIILGIIGSLLVLTVSELTVIWNSRIKTQVNSQRNNTFENSNLWFKTPRGIIHIKKYSYIDKEMSDVTINYFNNAFKLVRRLDAEKGILDNKKFFLQNVIEQKLNNFSNNYDILLHNNFSIESDILENDLERVGKASSEMGLIEIYKHTLRIESQGYNASCYWVDYYSKISFYLTCLVFSFVGAVVVFCGSNKNIVSNISYGIFLVFVYWVFDNLCVSLGYAGVIRPAISAGMTISIFMCIVICILMRLK